MHGLKATPGRELWAWASKDLPAAEEVWRGAVFLRLLLSLFRENLGDTEANVSEIASELATVAACRAALARWPDRTATTSHA